MARAARRETSQPGLSAQLRRIERVTGGELFVRSRHGVEPTRLGQFVLAKARRVLGEMDALAAGVRAAVPHPTLRLGSIELVLTDQLFGHLEQALPGHQIEVGIEHSVTVLTRMLGAGQYDAIMYGEVADHEAPLPDGAAARTLMPEEPACVRLSAAHPRLGPPAGRAGADRPRRPGGGYLADDRRGRRRRPGSHGQRLLESRLHAEAALPDRLTARCATT
ncbi:LysR family transcriptional regulator [Streptomyces sp. NPDC048219]|uniref:LysR family transcriptional regulator n=1 Tax=Streptomyces sp. NPDC048219 TaxID=3365517 RepID=UPI0037199AA8